MAVLIAVLGVVNTRVLSVLERSREIGMLRAVGLDRAENRRIIRWEALLISLFGAVLGIGTGIFLVWAAGTFAQGTITGYEMVVPWRIALFLVMAGGVGVLAAIWAARRAVGLNILTAVKAE
ncbi:ABC transporter permease [Streptomyces sp. NPDC052236]|uniref:ABC transporter permease n=1 Tax=Streptomyces sp. NPDC052236 TaxID=3365686 RepID=UPI0037D44488